MDEYLVPGMTYKRLLKEYNLHGSLFVAYDFDGTVHDYHKTGATYEDVRQLLRDLKGIGCKCICWTAYESHDYVVNFCKENNIPCDGVNTDGIPLSYDSRKPFYSVLLDDRAGLSEVYNDLTLLVQKVRFDNSLIQQ